MLELGVIREATAEEERNYSDWEVIKEERDR